MRVLLAGADVADVADVAEVACAAGRLRGPRRMPRDPAPDQHETGFIPSASMSKPASYVPRAPLNAPGRGEEMSGRRVPEYPENDDGCGETPDPGRMREPAPGLATRRSEQPRYPHVAEDRQHRHGQRVVAERLPDMPVHQRVDRAQAAAARAVIAGQRVERALRVMARYVGADRRDVAHRRRGHRDRRYRTADPGDRMSRPS